MIEVSGLTKEYGSIRAISDLNFTVKKGDVMGFLGPNGAGKTTTMRIITGYMPATEGTVKVAGFDVFEQPHEVKKRIGYLPERPPLYPYMVVDAYLLHIAELKGIPKNARKEAVERAIEKCALKDVSKRLIGHLSKGYQQRVGIAQAIIHNPEVLILDEPTIGLDPRQIVEIRQMIKELAGEHTIVLSTHILSEVSQICNSVIIINNGRIVADNTIEGLSKVLGEDMIWKVKIKKDEHEDILKAIMKIPGVVEVLPESTTFLEEAFLKLVEGNNSQNAL